MHSQFLGNLTQEERVKLVKRLHLQQNEICFICQHPIDLDIQDYAIDHIIPLNGAIEKGRDDDTNLAITHNSCNCSKSNSNLNIARSIYKIKNLQKEFLIERNKDPSKFSAIHQEATLGDLLIKVDGSKYCLNYKIENNNFIYSLQ